MGNGEFWHSAAMACYENTGNFDFWGSVVPEDFFQYLEKK